MAKYANYQRVCDMLFVIFTLVWIATRLGLYPFWIMRNTTIQAPKIVDMFPAYYIFNSLLFLLLTLHIFWTYLILKIAYNSLLVGKVGKVFMPVGCAGKSGIWPHLNYYRFPIVFIRIADGR